MEVMHKTRRFSTFQLQTLDRNYTTAIAKKPRRQAKKCETDTINSPYYYYYYILFL